MQYQVWLDAGAGDDSIEPLRSDWNQLSEAEQERFENDCSQCVGLCYWGIIESDSPEAALAIALAEVQPGDVYPGA
jgi:hypothetical protein